MGVHEEKARTASDRQIKTVSLHRIYPSNHEEEFTKLLGKIAYLFIKGYVSIDVRMSKLL